MRITRKRYENALKTLADAKKAEQIIRDWKEALKLAGPAAEHQEITEVQRNENGKWSWTAGPIEATVKS